VAKRQAVLERRRVVPAQRVLVAVAPTVVAELSAATELRLVRAREQAAAPAVVWRTVAPAAVLERAAAVAAAVAAVAEVLVLAPVRPVEAAQMVAVPDAFAFPTSPRR